jgi:hypothetical protein
MPGGSRGLGWTVRTVESKHRTFQHSLASISCNLHWSVLKSLNGMIVRACKKRSATDDRKGVGTRVNTLSQTEMLLEQKGRHERQGDHR